MGDTETTTDLKSFRKAVLNDCAGKALKFKGQKKVK